MGWFAKGILSGPPRINSELVSGLNLKGIPRGLKFILSPYKITEGFGAGGS